VRRRVIALLAVTLGLAVVAATGTALAVAGGAQDETMATPTTVAESPPATRFATELTQSLSVTATPPVSVPESLVSLTSTIKGANPAAGRVARISADGVTVYVLPSSDGFCLTSTSGVEGGCFTSPDVSASSVICAPGLPVDAVEVFGVAPNGIRELSINLADASSQTIPVQGNVWIYQTSKAAPRPLTVSWTDQTGARGSVPANVPSDYRDGTCATPADNAAPPAGASDATGPPVLRTLK
jgi:hypothetical protein